MAIDTPPFYRIVAVKTERGNPLSVLLVSAYTSVATPQPSRMCLTASRSSGGTLSRVFFPLRTRSAYTYSIFMFSPRSPEIVEDSIFAQNMLNRYNLMDPEHDNIGMKMLYAMDVMSSDLFELHYRSQEYPCWGNRESPHTHGVRIASKIQASHSRGIS